VKRFTGKRVASLPNVNQVSALAQILDVVALTPTRSHRMNFAHLRRRVEPLLHLQRQFCRAGNFELTCFGEPDMPTAIRVSTPISESDVSNTSDVSKNSDSSQFVSIAIFSGIGLLISLAVILLGVQGVWF
jgi:hypothetical protein